MYGWSNWERYLFTLRLNTSFTGPSGALPTLTAFGEPITSCFCQVNVLVNDRPAEYRLVALTWSESYQVLPSGAHNGRIVLNCGKGRSDWATVAVAGKPA